MKGMFKRALAGVAAAALAVTGLALGAGAANAVEGTPVNRPVQFTFTAETTVQLTNAKLTAYKIGDYVNYGTEDNPVYGVKTNAGNKTAVEAVLSTVAGYDASANGDAMAWALQEGKLDVSAVRPWDETVAGKPSTTRAFAEGLKTQKGMKAVEPDPLNLSVTGTTATVMLPAGVYLFVDTAASGSVTQAVPMIVAAGKTVDGVLAPFATGEGVNTVNMKNTKNDDKTKVVTEKSASIGDTLHYTLTGKVADPAPAEFSFVDTPGKGLTVNLDSITVKASGVADPLVENTDYTVTPEGTELNGNDSATFTVSLKAPSKYAGKTITVKYEATVNDEAPAEGTVVNKLDNYGTPVQVPTSLYSFDFTKKNADEQGLPGAHFTVADEDAPNTPLYFVKTDDGVYKKAVSDKTGGATTVLITGTNGKLEVGGLGLDNYVVHETAAPTDYQLPTDLTFTVKITKTGDGVSISIDQDTFHLASQGQDGAIEVLNVRNVTELPLTGAAGTMLFTVLGLLIAGAGALAYMKSRNVKHALRG